MMLAIENQNKSLNLTTGYTEPTTRPGHVKIQVSYASVNPTDQEVADGHYDLFLHLSRAKGPVRTGLEFAGIALEDSQHFKTGDRLYGYTHLLKGPKTHQAIISLPEDYVARMPDTISMADAASLPIGTLTGMAALQDIARLKKGQKLLLAGASGGVGLMTLQIARQMGLFITAVAGPEQQETLSDLGADHVIDYRKTEVTALAEKFDAIIDLSNTLAFKDIRHLLTKKGSFIPADPIKNLSDILRNPFRQQKTGFLFVNQGNREKLAGVSKMVESDLLKPLPGQIFDIRDYKQAFRQAQQSGNGGRILLEFDKAN